MSDVLEEHMLTTTDNPYDPFTQWDEWWQYDTSKGYYTSQFLARVVKSSDDLSDTDKELAIENAMQEIVRENVQGNYILVSRK